MYLLFAGYWYYPLGGWGDYQGTYTTLADAVRAAEKLTHIDPQSSLPPDWWQVVELSADGVGKIVKRKPE